MRWLTALALLGAPAVTASAPWWDGGVLGQLTYRFPVEIANGDQAKEDYPVTIEVNFTEKLLDVGEVGALDDGSIRVVRAVSDTSDRQVTSSPYLFEHAPDFGLISSAHGWVSWILDGVLAPKEKVTYYVYFDIQAHGVRMEAVPLSWEAIYYNPANKVQGGSSEPEAAPVDQSQSCWRGWGAQGQPESVNPSPVGHWGRWSLALVPGSATTWEPLVGLLESGRSYLMGGYVRSRSDSGDAGLLRFSFALGGTRGIRFTKEQALGTDLGWWRSEIPLPIAPDSSLFSVVLAFDGAVPDTLWVDDLFVYEDPPLLIAGPGEKLP